MTTGHPGNIGKAAGKPRQTPRRIVRTALAAFLLVASGMTAFAQNQPPAAAAEATQTAPDQTPGTGAAPARPAAASEPQIPQHDFTPWGMYQSADRVVKSVMIGLLLASILTWTIGFAKVFEILFARRRARRGLWLVTRITRLSDLAGGQVRIGGAIAAMLAEAQEELALNPPDLGSGKANNALARISSRIDRVRHRAGRRLARGTGWLAIVGSVAPFVGLFGTVWGIMNAFIGISQANTTNLAVVAPGIAEALLATAFGLAAAIPAVVLYNLFARENTGYRHLLADAAAAVERLASRELDIGVQAHGRNAGFGEN